MIENLNINITVSLDDETKELLKVLLLGRAEPRETKDVEIEVVVNSEALEADAKAAKKAAPAKKVVEAEAKPAEAKTYTLDDVRNAFIEAGNRDVPTDTRKAVITAYGVKGPNELDPQHYAAVIKTLNEMGE